MTPSILILSPLLAATGNTSTVQRLQSHFLKHCYNVSLLCSRDLLSRKLKCTIKSLNECVSFLKIDCVLLLHAVKSGSCVVCSCENNCKLSVKYGVIFGGTDLNEDVKDSRKLEIIQKCVKGAEFCIAFNEVLFSIAADVLLFKNVYQCGQAIDYPLYDKYFGNNGSHKYFYQSELQPFVFVLPCSIRPVKNPLYVIDCFEKIRAIVNKDVRLLLLGPVTDISYGLTFFNEICRSTNQVGKLDRTAFEINPFPIPNISSTDGESSLACLERWMNDGDGSCIQYLPALSQKEFFCCLEKQTFFAVLNTSESEGMSSTLLEAMAVGVPVVARNIPGNKSIVSDRKTGLLFSGLQEFVQKSVALLSNPDLLHKITTEAYAYVNNSHNPYNEAKFYTSLTTQFLTS